MGAKHLTREALLKARAKLDMSPRVFIVIRFRRSLWRQEIIVLQDMQVGAILIVGKFRFQLAKISEGQDNEGPVLNLWCYKLTRKRFNPEALHWQKA